MLQRNDQIIKAALDILWPAKVFSYDGDHHLIYTAYNMDHDADVDDETWFIWKQTWRGDELRMIDGPLIGSVSEQHKLAWRTFM